jgi:hypothetical protein
VVGVTSMCVGRGRLVVGHSLGLTVWDTAKQDEPLKTVSSLALCPAVAMHGSAVFAAEPKSNSRDGARGSPRAGAGAAGAGAGAGAGAQQQRGAVVACWGVGGAKGKGKRVAVKLDSGCDDDEVESITALSETSFVATVCGVRHGTWTSWTMLAECTTDEKGGHRQ